MEFLGLFERGRSSHPPERGRRSLLHELVRFKSWHVAGVIAKKAYSHQVQVLPLSRPNGAVTGRRCAMCLVVHFGAGVPMSNRARP